MGTYHAVHPCDIKILNPLGSGLPRKIRLRPTVSDFGEIKEDGLMFLGEYQLTFSGKGRVLLPKKLRDELGEDKEIILSRGFEGCIWGFSKLKFEEEALKQLTTSVTEERARYLRRYLFSSSVPTELDAQGRFVIPASLLDYAQVEDEVILIGAGDHFEIWNRDLWGKHLKKIERDYGR